MADALAPVRPGDPLRIPAEAYNAMLAAAKAHHAKAWTQSRHDHPSEPDTIRVPVKNIGETTLGRYHAVGIENADVVRGDDVILHGKSVTLAHRGRWVVATEPIPPGGIGMAVVAGITLVKLYQTELVYQCAEVTSVHGTPALATVATGIARLLWVSGEITQGMKLALIRFPIASSPGIRGGRLTSVLNCNDPSATATMEVMMGDTIVDTITVHPPRGQSLGVILPGMTVQAAYDSDLGRYVVLSGGKARKLFVRALSSFSAAASPQVEILDWDDGDDPDPQGSGLTAHNYLGFEGAAGSKWFAEYLPQLDRYRLYQGVCPEV